MANHDIAWKVVEPSPMPDWLHINKISGYGNTEISVSAETADYGTHESALTETIEISGSNGSITSVNVTRCVGKCVCYSANTPTTVTAVSYSSTSATISWSYKERDKYGNYGSVKTASSAVTFDANTETTEVTRTGTITWTDHYSCSGDDCSDEVISINWKVKVPGRPIQPCTCSYHLEPTETLYNVPCSGSSAFTVNYKLIYDRTNNCDPDNQCKNITTGLSTSAFTFECNSGNTIEDTKTITISGKSLTINYTQGGNCDCGQCTYTCADYLGATAYTIPANPTGDVKVFSFDVNNDKSKGDKDIGIFAGWYYRNSSIFTDTDDDDWRTTSSTTANIMRVNVYLPKTFIRQNTGSSRTETLYIKPYHCADKKYSGNETIPSEYACSQKTLEITQAGAEQTCTITSVSCNPASAYLSDSVTSVTTVVTVQGTGNACAKTWTATVRDSSVPGGSTVVTGNSGDSLTVKEPQTVTIKSLENTSKTCTFDVQTSYANKVNLSVNVGKNSMGQGMPYVQVQALTGSTNGVSLEGNVINGNSTYPFSIALDGLLGVGDYECGNFGTPIPSFEILSGGYIDSSSLRFINTPESFDPSSMLSAGRIDENFSPDGIHCQ